MNVLQSVRRLLGLEAKEFFIDQNTSLQRDSFFGGTGLPRTMYDYGRDVGQGFDSNVIMAPVMWIMRTFTEAHAVVERRTTQSWETVEDHGVEVLIDNPNEGYDGDALWKATCTSYILNGNAYWLLVRNAIGDVIQMWYIPHWLLTPRWPIDGSKFISHYEYRPWGNAPTGPGQDPSGWYPVLPRDVIHFRFGLDPRNPRYGLSPLRPLLREVFTDDEAANFSAKILENMGVPGLMVSPKDNTFRPSDEEVEKLKASMASAFTGDNRGAAMVMKVPTEVKQFGFDPAKLMLTGLRGTAEERVCAALGLPAAVVGFGAGLVATKVGATMRELRRLAWIQCLTPMQKSLARQLTSQLLPNFQSQTRRFRVRFDMSDVSVFQEEDDLRAVRVARLVQAGVLRVDRGQEMLGLEVDDTQKVYLRPSNSLPVGPDAPAQPVPNGAVAPNANPADQPVPDEGGGNPDAAPSGGGGTPDAGGGASGKSLLSHEMLEAIAARLGVTNGHSPSPEIKHEHDETAD